MNPRPNDPSDDPGEDIGQQELLELIASALDGLALNLETERDKRIYLAYVAARLGCGEGDGARMRARVEALRKELGL